MITTTLLAAALLLGTACTGTGTLAANAMRVDIGNQVLGVEIAADTASREKGLMGRQSLADDAGMLFVFPTSAPRTFWMHDTPLPLSIAFLDDDGRIINTADMAPLSDLPLYPSAAPARYALEVRYGWFAAHQIGPGTVCTFHLPADLVVY